MPTVPGKPKGKTAGGKRLFGQPAWVVIVGVGLAVVAGLYLRSRAASSAATSPTTATAPAADTSGGAGSSAASPADLTPVEDLASALNGLTGVLGAGGSFGVGSSAGGDTTGSVATPASDASSPLPTSTTTNNYYGSPAAQAPTATAYNPAPQDSSLVTPVGTSQPAGAAFTAPFTPQQIQSVADSAQNATAQSLAPAFASPSPQVIPQPTYSGSLVVPSLATKPPPVAGTTSNLNAVSRSKTLH